MNPTRLIAWTVGGIAGIAAAGFIASIVFFIWHDFDPNAARPWSIVIYGIHYWDNPRFQISLAVSLAIPLLAAIAIVVGPLFKQKPIYGDAKWANETSLRKSGLRDKSGVLLGKKGGRYLCSDTATHTLLVGPTRAGKGTGVVVPNCLNWQGSLVVLDVKGENYAVSAGFRAKHGHRVFFWSPMAKDGRSHRFNPLDEVSKDPGHRVSDVQVMASLLVDVSEKDPMWGLEARALFVGLTLYVLENRQTKTLGEVYRLLASDADLREVCRYVIHNTPDLSDEARRGLGSFASKAPKEASSVRSNLQSALRLFENPVIDAATSASDFTIRDLRRSRMAIYVGALASQLDALAPLLRLFFQQTIAVMSENHPGPDEPHKVLMLLDEFASLGAMDAVVTAFTLLAGYNVRILAVLQGLSWLDRNYGRDTREGIMSCCGNQVFMTTNDETTTAYVSHALGDRTVATSSTTRRAFSFDHDAPSRNTSTTGRPLLSKQEVRQLSRDKQIIVVEGHDPALSKKIRYFADRAFKDRLIEAPGIPALDVTPIKRSPAIPVTAAAADTGSATVNDDGGPIVPMPFEEAGQSSPGGANAPSPSPTKTLSASESAAFAEKENEFFAIVESEAQTNPHFAEARQVDIRRLREMDAEALI